MKIIGVDTETTGFLKADQRIIEVYAGRWEWPSGRLLGEYEQRINPARSVTPDAQRVHGISGAELIGKPLFNDIAKPLFNFLEEGDLVVAHNAQFDIPFINMELQRVGHPGLSRPVLDTLDARWATPQGKSPTLAELCFACGSNYDPEQAHAASYDVHRMMECLFWGLRTGWFKLPDGLATSHAVAA